MIDQLLTIRNTEINNIINQTRKSILDKLEDKINNWNPEEDSVGRLVILLEEYGSIAHKIKSTDSIKKIKSSSIHAEKVKLVKHYMKKSGDGNFLICDKDGFCIADIDQTDPFTLAAENEPIFIQHIDDLVEDYVEMVKQSEREFDEEN